jgi:hypothetical protein
LARNLYITAMEPQSGKTLVSLALMELLSTRVERLGFFRPVVPVEPDPAIELIRRRYRLQEPPARLRALTEDEAAALDYDELRLRVVQAYKELEAGCDFVLCEGSDFGGSAPALEFGRNADLANELGAGRGADGAERPREQGLRAPRRRRQPDPAGAPRRRVRGRGRRRFARLPAAGARGARISVRGGSRRADGRDRAPGP